MNNLQLSLGEVAFYQQSRRQKPIGLEMVTQGIPRYIRFVCVFNSQQRAGTVATWSSGNTVGPPPSLTRGHGFDSHRFPPPHEEKVAARLFVVPQPPAAAADGLGHELLSFFSLTSGYLLPRSSGPFSAFCPTSFSAPTLTPHISTRMEVSPLHLTILSYGHFAPSG